MTTTLTTAAQPMVRRLEGVTSVEAYRRLASLPHVVFFDSAMSHAELGRYSFVAADPFAWIEVPADGSDALTELERHLRMFATPTLPNLPPFQGGAAGLFAYDLGRSLERIPAATIDEFQIPAMAVGLYDVVVTFDHAEDSAWLISQGFPETDPDARSERAQQRLREMDTRLSGGWGRTESEPPAPPNPVGSLRSTTATPHLAKAELAPQHGIPGWDNLTSNFSAAGYQRAVQRVIDYIHAGDVFQVNLAQRLLHPAVSSSVDLYLRLRERNPAPFAGYFDLGPFQIASASPERFLQVRGDRVETRPIKGTRGRAFRPEADLFAGDELKLSGKDRAENIMIVDLLRNDLSRVCRPDSVTVSQLCGLETYAFVQHLVSVVEGRLNPDSSPIDLLRAAFPGGSITGAPKIRAMEIIAELEPTARGAYCGSLGYVGFDGTMDTNILIRSITAGRGWWQLPVGGGIVAQSDPAQEYEETWHKAAGLLKAIRS